MEQKPEQTITLEIPCVNAKLKNAFKNDTHADIKVIYNQKAVFNLQKAYLRIESQYFKERLDVGKDQQKKQLQIEAEFQEDDFERVLSCFYGMKHQIPRNEALKYWAIAKFFKADVLAKKLRDSIMPNIQQYDFFELLKLAHDYEENEIFQWCLKILEDSEYSMLKEHQFQFLALPYELFKIIIKWHNKAKLRGASSLSNIEIHDLIKAFCEQKPNQQELYLMMKHELLNAQNLSSAEYKLIYHDDILQMSQMNLRTIKTSNSFGNIFQTVIPKNPSLSQTANEFVMNSENTLYRKRIAELNQENQLFKKEVSEIKSQLLENNNAKAEFQKVVAQLNKSEQARMESIKLFENRLGNLQAEMTKKDELLKKQDFVIQQLKNELQSIKNIQNQSLNFSVSRPKQEEDITVQSKILPGEYFNDIFKQVPDTNKESTKMGTPARARSQPKDQNIFLKQSPFKKSPSLSPSPLSPERKSQRKVDLQQSEILPEQIQGHERLEFCEEPQTLTKEQHSNLIEILEIDSFKKVKLQLVFRAKKECNNLPRFLKSAKDRQNYLFLIHIWQWEKAVGAFISVPILGEGLISDPNSFIFSVTECRKFNSLKPKCIEVGNGSLIKFSGDLVVVDKCLDQQSQCNWPTSFEGDASIQKDPIVWFAGNRKFQISELQVYQIIEDDLQMKM